MMNVGKFIKRVRLLRGLSLGDCAHAVGISSRALSAVEAGGEVNCDVLNSISRVLRVDVDVLIVLLVPDIKSAKPSANKILKSIKTLVEAELVLEGLLNE